MSKFDKLYDAIKSGRTVLGVGPMSWNCIDATIELANDKQIPILMIASRRQVECSELGGGYVTDTKTLADHIKRKDSGGFVFLARDHGGPYQGANEENLTEAQARSYALMSYAADIVHGFDILHLDPSLRPRPLEEIKRDVKDFYTACESIAKLCNRDIIYEAGTEEHGGHTTKPEEFESFVKEIKQECPKIKFVVGNMGLYVKELQNVGKFDEEQAKKLVSICNDNQVYLKGHNADYLLETDVIKKQPQIGVHSINIAPQFGTLESKELLNNIDEDQAKIFIQTAFLSRKWKKWMIDESETKDEKYKATIAGHYVFDHPHVMDVKFSEGHDLEEKLKQSIRENIEETLRQLGWSI